MDALKKLHRIPRREDELRAALSAFCQGKQRMCIPAQPDDHDMVLGDGITELVAARAELERLRAGLATLYMLHHWWLDADGQGHACRATIGQGCQCGADDHNARIDALLAGESGADAEFAADVDAVFVENADLYRRLAAE